MQSNSPVIPAEQEKKNPIFAILGTAFGVVILCILLAAVVGLGYWAYTLNTRLTSTQQQLASLQSDYDTLKARDDKLTTDFAQSQSDLDKTKGDLTTAQTSLKNSQDQAKSQQARMAMAEKKIEVIEAIFWTNEKDNVIESLVKESNDSQLLAKWNTFFTAPSQATLKPFMDYLWDSAKDDLK